jgi:hypothetical protein
LEWIEKNQAGMVEVGWREMLKEADQMKVKSVKQRAELEWWELEWIEKNQAGTVEVEWREMLKEADQMKVKSVKQRAELELEGLW